MVKVVKRFDVFWVRLDPTMGSEIKKTRPCVIISPDEMNDHLRTVIIAPVTTSSKAYPSRVAVSIEGKSGEVVLDQIRTIDKNRLLEKMSSLNQQSAKKILQVLVEMFSI